MTPVVFLTVWLIGYLFILYFVEIFIYRKIKLIYKTIHSEKLSSSDKPGSQEIDLDEKVFGAVEEEVVEWADQQRSQIEHLKTLENYRREFLGNVSHELKTPIFNIQGYAHTLIDGAMEDEQVNEKFLHRIVKNTDRLITIVNDLDTISRLESGSLMLDFQRFGIRELVDEIFESQEYSAAKKNIKLTYKKGAQTNYQVFADRDYIRQVLDNLINNSIKYGREGGFTKVGFYDMEQNILVEVADNGIGIGRDHINHVFDRFYRVDKSRSREGGGSGLGLSIVKHIMEAHNQTISLRSTKGRGSTLGITLEKA